jgi:hypothetical protein
VAWGLSDGFLIEKATGCSTELVLRRTETEKFLMQQLFLVSPIFQTSVCDELPGYPLKPPVALGVFSQEAVAGSFESV